MVAEGESGGPEECLIALNTTGFFPFWPQGAQQTAWKQGFPAHKDTQRAKPKSACGKTIFLITETSRRRFFVL